MPRFVRRTAVPVAAERLFAWHDGRGAFERLTPPWQPVRLARFEGIRDGQQAVIKLGPGGLLTWVAEHRDFVPGEQFRDVQRRGPFAQWRHTHRMLPDGDGASVLEDDITYRLPLTPWSAWLGGGLAEEQLARMFAYRHRVTRADLAVHARYDLDPITIAITGSTGLLGEALVAFLTTGGHRVIRLVRSAEDLVRFADRRDERAVLWDPARGQLDADRLEGVDAVIHLAGESVYGLWTEEKKRRILESRALGTRLLAHTLARLDRPPRVLLSASGSGYYGDRGTTLVDESAASGAGFLAEVCRAWEAATAPAANAGIRVATLRLGPVLTPAGGLLKTALPAFQLGLGGWAGDGAPFFPWIALDDVLYAVLHLLATPSVSGPVNLGAPDPVTQRTFCETLGEVLHRPVAVRVPERAVRLLAGEIADELPLKSVRMEPAALVNSGFSFAYPHLEPALRHLLGKTAD